jgi:hypothetical protein
MRKSKVFIVIIFAIFVVSLFIGGNLNINAFNNKEDDCKTCHGYPATSLWLTVDKTSIEVSPEETFQLAIKGGGGTTQGTVIKIPSNVEDNGLFTLDNNMVSGTTGNLTLTTTVTSPSTTGTYTLRIFIATGSGLNGTGSSLSREATYKDIAVKITVPSEEKGINLAWIVQVTLGVILIGVISTFVIKVVTRKFGGK